MELLFRSSTAFEAVSEAIFDPQHDLEAFDRLFLQTWFVRLGVDKPEQYEQLIADLLHYPDVVLNPVKDNHKWHIAGFGHEAGHLLTWEMCRDPEVRCLCQNETTKGFGERVAEFCNKLLLDAYGISCKEVFPECDSWADYMYEKNPGKPLFDAMLDEIQLGSYTSFRSECIRILQRFQ